MNPAAPSPSDASIAQAYQEARDGKFVHTNIVGLFALIDKRAREIDASAPAASVGGGGDQTVAIAALLADFDGMDLDSLHTLRWSGGAQPEPMGDAWCMDYLPRAEAIVRLLANRSTPAAPVGGFVVVPREATTEQRKAGLRAANRNFDNIGSIYSAMIAASPAAQSSAKDGVRGEPTDEAIEAFLAERMTDEGRVPMVRTIREALVRFATPTGCYDCAYNGKELCDTHATTASGLVDGEREELKRLRELIHSPELHSFGKGVLLEAAHQRERWGNDHDAGKEPQDWFWLLGYLAGKALKAHSDGNTEKALHHTISSAAALANWHGAILGTHNMRPGIDGEAAIGVLEVRRRGIHRRVR